MGQMFSTLISEVQQNWLKGVSMTELLELYLTSYCLSFQLKS